MYNTLKYLDLSSDQREYFLRRRMFVKLKFILFLIYFGWKIGNFLNLNTFLKLNSIQQIWEENIEVTNINII